MRRTALIIAIFAIFAIIACGFGSAQAHAVPTARGQAVASPPPVLHGAHCVTVHSNVRHRTGTICAYLLRLSGKEGAEVKFTANSGLLKVVSVKTLQLTMAKHVVKTIHNVSKTVVTSFGGAAIPLNWWDEPFGLAQAGVYKACMTWTDGGKACTGSGWLYSQPERL